MSPYRDKRLMFVAFSLALHLALPLSPTNRYHSCTTTPSAQHAHRIAMLSCYRAESCCTATPTLRTTLRSCCTHTADAADTAPTALRLRSCTPPTALRCSDCPLHSCHYARTYWTHTTLTPHSRCAHLRVALTRDHAVLKIALVRVYTARLTSCATHTARTTC
jgi:hypothetical protein